jgi:predicted dehydrogenase
MRTLNAAVIGTGWIGSMRAQSCVASHLVDTLYLSDLDAAKGEKIAKETGAVFTIDYKEILSRDDVETVFVSTTPESTHFPIARDCLLAGKHVLLEKPMAQSLEEADELIGIAQRSGLTFSIGYTTRWNPKYAYIKQCLDDGTLGKPVTAVVQHSDSRSLGNLIGGRTKLGLAKMIATHDLDFVLWWMEPAKPKRVFAQTVSRVFKDTLGLPDAIWIIVTMDDGTAFTVNWTTPTRTRSCAR